ncbi:MAG TPA: rRNA maturation RNase YbeY [Candidatus Acidoferrales bacterium]|nr:rRNA maturation RNase YbeY [Candidatus Acidoferrales bacterium]
MVINRQKRVRVASVPLETFLGRVMTLLHAPAGSVTVCLVDDAQMARWNRAYRDKSKPTDVLSFPANGASRGKNPSPSPNGAAHGTYLGDIAIAPAVAKKNALALGRTLSEELRVLILHGVLHLLGYDHETDNGQMERLEMKLRARLGIG